MKWQRVKACPHGRRSSLAVKVKRNSLLSRAPISVRHSPKIGAGLPQTLRSIRGQARLALMTLSLSGVYWNSLSALSHACENYETV